MAKKLNSENPLVKHLIQENNIKTAADAQFLLKNLFKDMVNVLLEAELDETLGYEKYERSENTDNSRNGYNKKNVNTSLGKIQLNIPRD